MKIVCTLREFESFIARCPMYNYLLDDKEAEECRSKCIKSCILSSVCKPDDANWSFSDLVEIVPNNNK